MIKKETNHDKIWDGSFTFVCWTYFVILLMFISLRVVSGLGWLEGLDNRVVEIGFSFLSQIVIMAGVPLVAMYIYKKRKEGKTEYVSMEDAKPKTNLWVSFGFDKPSIGTIGFAFLLGFLIYFFNIFVASFFNGILGLFGFRFGGGIGDMSFTGIGGLFVMLTLIAVLPGICEEVSHRGMLLKSFSSRMGIMRAMLFSSILFGFMHLNIVQVFFAAVLGYIIALATVATKSLWVGIIMHFMNNALATYLSIANRNGWFGGNLLQDMMSIFSGMGFILYIAFAIFLFWAIFQIIHVLARRTYEKDKSQHLITIIKQDPSVLTKPDGGVLTLDEFTATVDVALPRLSKWQKTKFFVDPMTLFKKRPMNLTRHERMIFYGILFMGGLITLFTMVWGFL